MIVRLLALKCDFCQAEVIDESPTVASCRKTMALYGWRVVKGPDGTVRDQCPVCHKKETSTNETE